MSVWYDGCLVWLYASRKKDWQANIMVEFQCKSSQHLFFFFFFFDGRESPGQKTSLSWIQDRQNRTEEFWSISFFNIYYLLKNKFKLVIMNLIVWEVYNSRQTEQNSSDQLLYLLKNKIQLLILNLILTLWSIFGSY